MKKRLALEAICSVAEHASGKPHGIVSEGEDASSRHEHDSPSLKTLLVRKITLSARPLACRRVPQIRGSLVKTVAHLRKFETSGYYHDTKETLGIVFQKIHEGLAKKKAQYQFEYAQDNDAGAAASTKPILCSQTSGTVADRHASKPSAA
ncbi:hypothetical protein HG530_013349 [Fusarium avenaceum]|nr:hypothetical protein HG530_013349 [Fusarium avenaceum]